MSDTRKDLPPVSAANFLARVREVLQVYLGSQGSELDRGLTVRDIVGSGLATLNPNGGSDTLLVPSVPTGGTGGGSSEVYEPDLTIPPSPSSFTAVAGLTSILVETEPPIYSAGHGHGVARLFGVTRLAGDPLPTFASAVELSQFQGDVTSYATGLGKTWHLWLIWRSKDGVDSAPAGGTNGVSVTTGRIGTSDLNDLIIEAGKLANGAITADKFTAGIEPVTIVASVPGAKVTSTVFNTADGKLYRWSGAAYTKLVSTADLSGTVADAQIAGVAASKVTGTLTDSQLAEIAAAKVTGQIVGTQITDGAVTTTKLFAGSVTTAKIAADAVTSNEIAAGAVTASEIAAGAVTTAKLVAGAVTANEIAAGAVVAGKVAADAITATELAADSVTAGKVAAGAITASKLFVTGAGAAMNADPSCMDSSAWLSSPVMLIGQADMPAGSTAIANTTGAGKDVLTAELIPIEQLKRYRVEALVKQTVGSTGIIYLGVAWYDANKALLTSNAAQPGGAGSPAGWGNGSYSYFGLIGVAAPATWTRYVASFGSGEAKAIPSNAKYIKLVALLNHGSTAGVQHAVSGFKLMEKADADLIVDGAIVASKLAANAIAVGTAAVQNGAIVNAMIGTAAIDDAKISNLSAAKLTAGDGTIGGDLKSSNFATGSAGWRVRPDGTAEFGFAHIRGTLQASQVAANFITANMIDARGLSIKDASGNVILSAGSAVDWTKLGGASSNLSGLGYTGALDATRNVYRGAWTTAVAYTVGDVVTSAGSSWSARTSHTSATGTNNPPTLPTTSNTWWELSAAKGDVGSSGPASISVVLSNEAHVLPATSDGTVSSYTGSGTEIRVYEGAAELTYDGVGTANGSWKVTTTPTNITLGTLTDSGTYLTVLQHLGVAAGTDTSSIVYTITGKTASGTGFTLTKTQTFTKSKQGSGGSTGLTGPAGPSVLVTASRATTFTATDGALDAAQADITFTAAVSGISSPTYVWSFSGFQTEPTNSGVATQTITAAQFGTSKSATVTCTVSGTYTDVVTIVRLEKSTAAAGATVGAPTGTSVGGSPAETVAVKALAALQKTGDTITGRINMSVTDGLFAGTDLNNGVYLGNGGLLAKKAGVTTFAIDTSGNASFAGALAAATGSFAGSLSAATGTFAGSLSAATGTFAGTLTAAAVNAVNTINIAGNAVTVPASAEWSGSSLTSGSSAITTTPSSDYAGGSVNITVSVVVKVGDTRYSGAYTYLTIYRNGSQIRKILFGEDSGSVTFTRSAAICIVDSPGGGSFTYGVGCSCEDASTSAQKGTLKYAGITAIGTKR